MKINIRKSLLVLFFYAMASPLGAEDCSSMWVYELNTDPLKPKGMSGDANGAYGVFSFYADPSKKYSLKGNFPNSRFMSIDTNYGKMEYKVDAILDYGIEPDAGSENPFREGVALDAKHRFYTVEVLPYDARSVSKNVLRLSASHRIHAIMARIFSPNVGFQVEPTSFPRVYALDSKTGAPTSCPEYAYIPSTWRIPEFLTVIVPPKKHFAFKEIDFSWGPNSAVPLYIYAVNPLKKGDEVIVIRFRAPSYANTLPGTGPFHDAGDVRYWSFGAQDFPKNITLSGIPDYLAKVDEKGFATIVFGSGKEVREAAEDRGFNFIDDTRAPEQRVIGFVYRNLLPKPDFAKNFLNKGEYQPRGVLCSRQAFLDDHCS